MFKRSEIEKEREGDHKKLEKIKSISDDIARGRKVAIEEKGKELVDRALGLADKKSDLYRSPLTKQETLEILKTALKENRKRWFFDGILVPHVQGVQVQKQDPLRPEDIRVYAISPENAWKLFYAVLTERDLEEAVATLPDIGLSPADREAEIRKIDLEIAALEAQVEKDLKKL